MYDCFLCLGFQSLICHTVTFLCTIYMRDFFLGIHVRSKKVYYIYPVTIILLQSGWNWSNLKKWVSHGTAAGMALLLSWSFWCGSGHIPTIQKRNLGRYWSFANNLFTPTHVVLKLVQVFLCQMPEQKTRYVLQSVQKMFEHRCNKFLFIFFVKQMQ